MAEWRDIFRRNRRLALSLRKALVVILFFDIAALFFMYIVRKFLYPLDVITPDAQTLEVFFSVFGIIYAIIVGLLVVEALRRFHTLGSIIEQELNAVEDIRDFLLYLDGNQEARREIQTSLLDYINSVTKREWENMRCNPEVMDSDTSNELRHLMKTIRKIRVTNDIDRLALKSIIDKVAEVTTYRTERIKLAEEHISGPLRRLIIFMSVVILCGFSLMYVEGAWIHGLMVFVIATAIVGLYLVIEDLNRPFGGGFWDIENTSFVKVAEGLKSSLERKNDL